MCSKKEIEATTRIGKILFFYFKRFTNKNFYFFRQFSLFIALAVCGWLGIKLWNLLLIFFRRLLAWIVLLWLFHVRAELLLWLFFVRSCLRLLLRLLLCKSIQFASAIVCVWSLWRHGVCSRFVCECVTRWMSNERRLHQMSTNQFAIIYFSAAIAFNSPRFNYVSFTQRTNWRI